MPGLSALFHQTALRTLAELERIDPDNPTAAMARLVFESFDPNAILPTATTETRREYFARRKRERAALDQQAAELYKSGKSLIEVGTTLGKSPGWVTDALIRTGTTTRPKGPRGHKIIDHDRVEKIRNWRAEHPPKTLEAIGAELHISRERVRQICAANGIDSSPSTELDERQLLAVADYLDGASLELVASKYEVGKSAVRNWICRAGHVPRHIGRRLAPETKAASERAVKLYRQGKKAREIAADLGLPHTEMIYRLLAIGGVAPDRNSGAGRGSVQ